MIIIELLLMIVLSLPIFFLILSVLSDFDPFGWVSKYIDSRRSKRKLKRSKGAKELKELIGVTAYKWTMKNLIKLEQTRTILYFEDELLENDSINPDESYVFVSLKFFYVLNEFIKNPDKFNFLQDYQGILQSIYSSYEVYVNGKLITKENFWLERAKVVNELYKDFLLVKKRKEILISAKRKNEVIALRKKNEEDMDSIRSLKEYRKKYYG